MEPDQIVRGTIGGMSIIFSVIMALAGFVFFGGIGYLFIVEANSTFWKLFGGFLVFCGLFILVFILGTIYLTFSKHTQKHK